jgi:hypothetical protein
MLRLTDILEMRCLARASEPGAGLQTPAVAVGDLTPDAVTHSRELPHLLLVGHPLEPSVGSSSCSPAVALSADGFHSSVMLGGIAEIVVILVPRVASLPDMAAINTRQRRGAW